MNVSNALLKEEQVSTMSEVLTFRLSMCRGPRRRR